MPGSFIGELILRSVLEFIFHVVSFHVGRVLVPIISFGQIKCDRFTADPPRRKLRRAGGLYHRRGEEIYLSAEATALAGSLFIVLLVGGGFLFYYCRP